MGKKQQFIDENLETKLGAENAKQGNVGKSLHGMKTQAFQELANASSATQRLIALRNLLEVLAAASETEGKEPAEANFLALMIKSWKAFLDPGKNDNVGLKSLILNFHEIKAWIGMNSDWLMKYGAQLEILKASIWQKLRRLPEAQSRALIAYLENPLLQPDNAAINANFNRPEAAIRELLGFPPKFSMPRAGNSLRASATLQVLKEGKRHSYQTGLFSSPAKDAAPAVSSPPNTLSFRAPTADMMALQQLNSYAHNHGLIYLPGVLWLDLNAEMASSLRNMLQLYSKIFPNLLICIRFLQTGAKQPELTTIQANAAAVQMKAKQSNGIWQLAMKAGQVYWL